MLFCAVLCCAELKCIVQFTQHSTFDIILNYTSLNQAAGATLNCWCFASVGFVTVCVETVLHAVLQVEDLKRFMPQIVHIVQPGFQPAATANKNVGSAKGLTEIFSFAG